MAGAAWDAYGCSQRPALQEHVRAAHVSAWLAERSLWRYGAAEVLAHPEATVERLRRSFEPYRDGQGRARRRPTVTRVLVPAHEAWATRGKWHEGRAGGQRARMDNVGHCGAGIVGVHCSSCGVAHEVPAYCGVARLCAGCNARRVKKTRARFSTALGVVAPNAERAGSFERRRPGGALSQKMLTLTIPHVVDARGMKATASLRCDLLFRVWRRFSRRLQHWLREPWKGEERQEIGACWFRSFEWTEGDDGMGHPHLHLWMLAPWIPESDDHRIESIAGGRRRPTAPCAAAGDWRKGRAAARERRGACAHCKARVERRRGIRSWWSQALEAEGVAIEAGSVIVGIRVGAGGERTFREVSKPRGIDYRGKRTRYQPQEFRDHAGRIVDYLQGFSGAEACSGVAPEVIAGVMEALEGRRLNQASKVLLRRSDGRVTVHGFLGLADSFRDASCRSCNEHAALERRCGRAADAGFPARRVEVTTWQTIERGTWATGPPALAPPEELPAASDGLTVDARIARLVKSLQAEERIARGELARTLEICELIRTEGPGLVPAYRRRGWTGSPPRRRTVRAQLLRGWRS